ncbi:hypothetical protein BKA70DRAFT_1275175, partial [Coprinopsis sp. MPI-PUGE-AT-0042]
MHAPLIYLLWLRFTCSTLHSLFTSSKFRAINASVDLFNDALLGFHYASVCTIDLAMALGGFISFPPGSGQTQH